MLDELECHMGASTILVPVSGALSSDAEHEYDTCSSRVHMKQGVYCGLWWVCVEFLRSMDG